jgi:hypothetical protein
MKLNENQKNKIENELIHSKWSCDPFEWFPAVNYMLELLDYDDRLIYDEDYDFQRWGTKEDEIDDTLS